MNIQIPSNSFERMVKKKWHHPQRLRNFPEKLEHIPFWVKNHLHKHKYDPQRIDIFPEKTEQCPEWLDHLKVKNDLNLLKNYIGRMDNNLQRKKDPEYDQSWLDDFPVNIQNTQSKGFSNSDNTRSPVVSSPTFNESDKKGVIDEDPPTSIQKVEHLGLRSVNVSKVPEIQFELSDGDVGNKTPNASGYRKIKSKVGKISKIGCSDEDGNKNRSEYEYYPSIIKENLPF